MIPVRKQLAGVLLREHRSVAESDSGEGDVGAFRVQRGRGHDDRILLPLPVHVQDEVSSCDHGQHDRYSPEHPDTDHKMK